MAEETEGEGYVSLENTLPRLSARPGDVLFSIVAGSEYEDTPEARQGLAKIAAYSRAFIREGGADAPGMDAYDLTPDGADWVTTSGDGWSLRDDPGEPGPVLTIQGTDEVRLTRDQATVIDGVERPSVFDRAFDVFPLTGEVSRALMGARLVQVSIEDCEHPQALRLWTEDREGKPGQIVSVKASFDWGSNPPTRLVFVVEEYVPVRAASMPDDSLRPVETVPPRAARLTSDTPDEVLLELLGDAPFEIIDDHELVIHWPDGDVHARVGDWLIRDEHGLTVAAVRNG